MAPPSSTSSAPASPIPTDTQALALAKTRKEMRKTTHTQGLVQLKCGEIETREVVLSAPPAVEFVSGDDQGEEGESGSEDEDEDSASGDDDDAIDPEEGDEEGGEDEESEGDDEEVVVQPSRKRKRLQQRQDAKPAKKTVAPPPKRQKLPPTKVKPTAAPKRIANAGQGAKSKKATESKPGEAYDFGKFF